MKTTTDQENRKKSKAVFGLICDFNVIVDFAKFYCNPFIIAKL